MHWQFLKTPSLALRLTLVFSLSIAIVAGLYLSVQAFLVHRFGDFITQQSLMGQTHDIAEAMTLDERGVLSVRLQGQDAENFDAFFANLKYRVVSSDGQVLATSDSDFSRLLPGVALDQQDGRYLRTEINGIPFHVASVRHRFQGRYYWVQVGRSDQFAKLAHEAIAPAIAEAVGIMATLAIGVLAVLSYWGVRNVLQPIRLASQAARTVGQNNLSVRIPMDPLPAEIRPLVIAFNDVLARLEVAFNAQQRFFANAAHELKTPIALLRAQLEAQIDSLPPKTLEDVDALGRTVNQLLHVAEVTGGRPLKKQPVSLDEITRQVCRFLSWRAQKAEVSVQIVRESPDLGVMADSGELFVLLKNLVENAVDHSPQGGTVRISLSQGCIRVEDEGQGVAEHHRSQVFERFWRAADNKKPGSGLGLSICMEVARAHGWQLKCKPSVLGGALFELNFEATALEHYP
jgi:signal transduction histidine kinase